jgi:hypothetical protein
MNRSGCPISEALVGSLVIVKLEVISQTYLQSRNCSIFVDIDVLILPVTTRVVSRIKVTSLA